MARLMTQLIGSTSTRLGMLRRCKTSSAAASMAHGHDQLTATPLLRHNFGGTCSPSYLADIGSITGHEYFPRHIHGVCDRAAWSDDVVIHVVATVGLTRTMSLGLAAVIIASAVCSIVV